MKIVYFLGAGASANAIPTINGIRNRILDLKFYLESFLKNQRNEVAFQNIHPVIQNNQTTLNTIIEELTWLYDASKNHQTVDTLAKKLFLQESNDLKKLKRALISYFYFEQNINFPSKKDGDSHFKKFENLMDLRYDSLFANLINRKQNNLEINGNISIVTWNYDLQIDMALKNYIDKSFNNLKSELRIHPNKESYNLANGNIVIENEFNVLKLNGNAFLDSSLQRKSELTIYDKSWNEKNEENVLANYINELINEFTIDLKLSNSPAFKYFNFAWENNKNFGSSYEGKINVIDSAKQIISNADVLIVIGYSFPTLNFEVDKKIFSNCQLKELIIQDEKPDNIKERMKPLLKQLNLPNNKDNPQLKYSPIGISQYFPIYKY